jgi:hypothetical protein
LKPYRPFSIHTFFFISILLKTLPEIKPASIHWEHFRERFFTSQASCLGSHPEANGYGSAKRRQRALKESFTGWHRKKFPLQGLDGENPRAGEAVYMTVSVPLKCQPVHQRT